MDADGDFVVAWQSYGQDASNGRLRPALHRRAASPRGRVPRQHRHRRQPDSPRRGDGRRRRLRRRLAEHGQDGGGYGVYAQRYNAAGVAQGAEFRVNTYDRQRPALPLRGDGRRRRLRRRLARATARTRAAATASTPSATTPPACRRAASSASTPSPPATSGTPRWRWTPTATSSSPGRATARTRQQHRRLRPALQRRGRRPGDGVPRQHHSPPSSQAYPVGGDGRRRRLRRRLDEHRPGRQRHRRRLRPALQRRRRRRRAASSASTRSPPATSASPSVAMDADGDFVVTWQSYGQDRRGRRPASTPSASTPPGSPQGSGVPRQHDHGQPPALPRRGDGRRRRLRRRLGQLRPGRAGRINASTAASTPSGTAIPPPSESRRCTPYSSEWAPAFKTYMERQATAPAASASPSAAARRNCSHFPGPASTRSRSPSAPTSRSSRPTWRCAASTSRPTPPPPSPTTPSCTPARGHSARTWSSTRCSSTSTPIHPTG